VIAMENARLITETREALAQQTATSEVLGVINSSPGDLAPVFDAMLDKAAALCDAPNGQLAIYDGEFFWFVAAHGEATHVRDLLARGTMLPVSGTTWPRIVAGERVVHIPDVMESEHYRTGHENTRRFVEVSGGRSLLTVALRKDNTLMGALSVYRGHPQPFTDKQIALVQNFAAQAVIAMENARLITETREALEQQTATAEVLGVINSSPGDLAPVFDAILEKALGLCEANLGNIATYDGEAFRFAAAAGHPEFAEFLSREAVRPSPVTGWGRIAAAEQFVHIVDLAAEQAYKDREPLRVATVELGGARTCIFVPLVKDSAILGVLTAYRQEVRPFTDKQIALLQNFAAQAVIAMENARLLGELRERTEEIAGWNKELEERVASQLGELERTGKLRRFLAPQLADLIVARGDESILESHRREIVVVFCDLRGFTPFAERAEPEEVMALLKEYHATLGPIVATFEGTLDHYSGDGIMVFFNDPLPTPEPAKRAVEMARAMRAAAQDLLRSWRRHGHDLGFGVGISQGYATLGQIGFAERMDYTAIGTVTNLAARLCGEAKDGQILISARVATTVEDSARLEEIGDLSLKGLSQAVAVFNVVD
jgi:class 3 adenylate cyclase